jgi:ubiquinone/menaquinone biosynthesis C-methylase UbiE
MMRTATRLLVRSCRELPFLRPLVWKRVYEFVGKNYPAEACVCLNYGYAPGQEESGNDFTTCREEPERYCLQLYQYVVSALAVQKGGDILEIGSGRGGGARFLKSYLEPRRMVGVDFSHPAVMLAAKPQSDGLFFITGEADRLPLADQSFDVVVNIESSHCYRSLEAFVREVKRVMRPRGCFLYADFCQAEKFVARRELLRKAGLSIVREDDITANVVAALEQDQARRQAVITKYVSRSLVKSFQEIAGLPQSRVYDDFKKRRKIYFRLAAVNQ